jgi:hypothetical protein
MESETNMPNLWRNKSAHEVQHLAIVFSLTPDSHLSLIYVDDDQQPRWLHLAWHHHVRERPVDENYAWGEPPLEPELRAILSRLCRRIARRYVGQRRSIAYALRYAGGRFDEMTGEFLCEDGLGLTCATFVMAVFATRGVALLRRQEWEPRDEDVLWQEKIIELLKNARDPKINEHVAVVRTEVGCARFRPEEVAAAGVATALPLGFREAESKGKAIREWLAMQIAS